jgi:hypothetical protein
MYRLVLTVLMCGASLGHGQRSPAPAPAPIFRDVEFPPYNAIRLGEVLPPHAPPGQSRNKHRLVLAGFGGTDSIAVALDDSGHVTALEFVYPVWSDYPQQLRQYTATLGRPALQQSRDSAGGSIERTLWQDAHTRFELLLFARGGAIAVFTSMLSDHPPTARAAPPPAPRVAPSAREE